MNKSFGDHDEVAKPSHHTNSLSRLRIIHASDGTRKGTDTMDMVLTLGLEQITPKSASAS